MSNSKALRISGNGPGRGGYRVELDGRDVSSALTGLSLRLEAGAAPTATLDVATWETPAELDQVRVVVPDETRTLLVQLGWTPPPDGEQQEDKG